MNKRTHENVNLRSSLTIALRSLLTVLLISLFIPVSLSGQSDQNFSSNKTSKKDSEGAINLERRIKEIRRMAKKGYHGPAYFKTRNLIFDLQKANRPLQQLKRVGELEYEIADQADQAFKKVKKKTHQLVQNDRYYRAYQYLKGQYPRFEKGLHAQKLHRRILELKKKINTAYRNGRTEKKVTVLEETVVKKIEENARNNGSSYPDRSNKKSTNPRIYATGSGMSGQSNSPKAFEGKVISKTDNSVRFQVDFKGQNDRNKMGFFLFELRGLAGREKVSIEFTNMGRWKNSKTIVPMYSRNIDTLSEMEMLRSQAPADGRIDHFKTTNGQIVPRTNGLQNWHYFRRVNVEDAYNRITVKKKFPKEMEHTYIAHRAPYTWPVHRNFIQNLVERSRNNSQLSVHRAGTSQGGRPLYVIRLKNPTDPNAREKPVIVYTSGEHPDEMDTYHSMLGALHFLLSDASLAKTLRKKATFLFVPVLDPDGLERNMYENICYSFSTEWHFDPGTPTDTSLAYTKWFRKWANRHRLDVHIDTHCVESGETSDHLFNYLIETESGRKKLSRQLWDHVKKQVRNGDFRVTDNPSDTGYTPNRLGGLFRSLSKTMQLFVEFNSQAKRPGRKLTLYELRKMGRFLTASVVDYLYSKKAKPLLKQLEKKRQKRWRLVDRYELFVQHQYSSKNVFEKEAFFESLPEKEARHWKLKKGIIDYGPSFEGEKEDRFEDGYPLIRMMYNRYDISPENVPGGIPTTKEEK